MERLLAEAHPLQCMLSIHPREPVGALGRHLSMHREQRPLASAPCRYPSGSRIGFVSIEAPSPTFLTAQPRSQAFRLDHPSNWRARQSADGLGIAIAPEGGVLDVGGGEKELVYGVIVHGYAAEGRRLAEAMDELGERIVRANPVLRRVTGSSNGDPRALLVLSGRSEVTGEEERVTVVTRPLSAGHVLLFLLVAPGEDYGELAATFEHMVGSVVAGGSSRDQLLVTSGGP